MDSYRFSFDTLETFLFSTESLSLPSFYRVLRGIYLVVPGFTGFYRVFFCFICGRPVGSGRRRPAADRDDVDAAASRRLGVGRRRRRRRGRDPGHQTAQEGQGQEGQAQGAHYRVFFLPSFPTQCSQIRHVSSYSIEYRVLIGFLSILSRVYLVLPSFFLWHCHHLMLMYLPYFLIFDRVPSFD